MTHENDKIKMNENSHVGKKKKTKIYFLNKQQKKNLLSKKWKEKPEKIKNETFLLIFNVISNVVGVNGHKQQREETIFPAPNSRLLSSRGP
jgi:hypothetical protein